jgi:hypothetical protein
LIVKKFWKFSARPQDVDKRTDKQIMVEEIINIHFFLPKFGNVADKATNLVVLNTKKLRQIKIVILRQDHD